jgi:hypothetical protein
MRTVIIVITAAAALFSSPAFAQQHDTPPIPDFSGIWARLSFPGFEPPLFGPGPVTNRSRRNGASNYDQLVGDYNNPILQPWAAEVVKKFGEMSLAGITFPNPRNQCWPGGVPYVFSNLGMQMVQQPDTITILYSDDHEVRRVRMNKPHPARVMPSWYGDSVGRYEGDTLVIDTVGIKIGPYAMIDWYGTPYSARRGTLPAPQLRRDDRSRKKGREGEWSH